MEFFFELEFVIGTVFGLLSLVSMFCKIYTYLVKLRGSESSHVNDGELQLKDDFEDGVDEEFFDALSEIDHPKIDLNTKQRSKTVAELYRAEVEQQESEELQLLRFRACCAKSTRPYYQDTGMINLLEAVQELCTTVDTQQQLFEVGKNNGKDVDILNVLNTLTRNTSEIKNKMSSIEKNTEQLKNKYGVLKTRISNIERESMKNSAIIKGMDYSYLTLLSARPDLGLGAVVAENSFDSHPRSNTHYQPPVAPTNLAFMQTVSSSPAHLQDSRPLPPPSPVSAVVGPPPPPPPMTTVFGTPPPPPPPPPMKASRDMVQATAAMASSTPVTATAPKTYSRIEITEDLLKSVVLKPPGQRRTGNRILTK